MGLWAIAAIGAFFVKGLCGFANTLVFTSVLGFASDNVNISPVELVLGFPPNLILAWKERTDIEGSVWFFGGFFGDRNASKGVPEKEKQGV